LIWVHLRCSTPSTFCSTALIDWSKYGRDRTPVSHSQHTAEPFLFFPISCHGPTARLITFGQTCPLRAVMPLGYIHTTTVLFYSGTVPPHSPATRPITNTRITAELTDQLGPDHSWSIRNLHLLVSEECDAIFVYKTV